MPERIHITQYSHAMNRSLFPIENAARSAAITEVSKSKMSKGEEGGAYRRLRIARSDVRQAGAREKRAKAKEDAAAAQKK